MHFKNHHYHRIYAVIVKSNEYTVREMSIFQALLLQPYKLLSVIAYITALKFLCNDMFSGLF